MIVVLEAPCHCFHHPAPGQPRTHQLLHVVDADAAAARECDNCGAKLEADRVCPRCHWKAPVA